MRRTEGLKALREAVFVDWRLGKASGKQVQLIGRRRRSGSIASAPVFTVEHFHEHLI